MNTQKKNYAQMSPISETHFFSGFVAVSPFIQIRVSES